MLRRLVILALLCAPLPGAAGDLVCRPDALGTVSCAGDVPRPKPRPIYRAPVQAIDRVDAEAGARHEPERFVPSRETRRLGGTTILDGGLSGPCRADTLGNLNCR